MVNRFAKEILEYQIYEMNNIQYGSISEEKKLIIKDNVKKAKYVNKLYLEKCNRK